MPVLQNNCLILLAAVCGSALILLGVLYLSAQDLGSIACWVIR
jgi:hypothetical protein